MAKQSGLHQIRGKVGEHSYYKQTGVGTGLIRSINQGMSNRVKTGAEYANTRLNNAEFGHACKIAGVLGHTIMPKFRPMILPFSQSKMAKIILDEIKLQTGNWGERSLPSGDAGKAALDAALRSVVKNDPSDYGLTISLDQNVFTVEADNDNAPAKLAELGGDYFVVNIVRNNVQVGNYVDALRGYQYSYRVYNQGSVEIDVEASEEITITLPQLPPVPAGQANTFELTIAVIMPIRTVNGKSHILQEGCTFMVL